MLSIRERIAELKQLMKSEKNVRRRERIHLLYLYKSGVVQTQQEAANILAIDRDTVNSWLSSYKQGGLRSMLEIKTHSNHKRSISDTILEKVKKN